MAAKQQGSIPDHVRVHAQLAHTLNERSAHLLVKHAKYAHSSRHTPHNHLPSSLLVGWRVDKAEDILDVPRGLGHATYFLIPEPFATPPPCEHSQL